MTLAWNTYRHFETYYAVSGIGAITHTLNPRLAPAQLTYIVNHAEDSYIFADTNLVPLIEAVASELSSLKGVVVMTDKAHMPDAQIDNLICYEELIDSHSDDLDWPEFDENTASSLCYTSTPLISSISPFGYHSTSQTRKPSGKTMAFSVPVSIDRRRKAVPSA